MVTSPQESTKVIPKDGKSPFELAAGSDRSSYHVTPESDDNHMQSHVSLPAVAATLVPSELMATVTAAFFTSPTENEEPLKEYSAYPAAVIASDDVVYVSPESTEDHTLCVLSLLTATTVEQSELHAMSVQDSELPPLSAVVLVAVHLKDDTRFLLAAPLTMSKLTLDGR